MHALDAQVQSCRPHPSHLQALPPLPPDRRRRQQLHPPTLAAASAHLSPNSQPAICWLHRAQRACGTHKGAQKACSDRFTGAECPVPHISRKRVPLLPHWRCCLTGARAQRRGAAARQQGWRWWWWARAVHLCTSVAGPASLPTHLPPSAAAAAAPRRGRALLLLGGAQTESLRETWPSAPTSSATATRPLAGSAGAAAGAGAGAGAASSVFSSLAGAAAGSSASSSAASASSGSTSAALAAAATGAPPRVGNEAASSSLGVGAAFLAGLGLGLASCGAGCKRCAGEQAGQCVVQIQDPALASTGQHSSSIWL